MHFPNTSYVPLFQNPERARSSSVRERLVESPDRDEVVTAGEAERVIQNAYGFSGSITVSPSLAATARRFLSAQMNWSILPFPRRSRATAS
jgi:hypothetical protein